MVRAESAVLEAPMGTDGLPDDILFREDGFKSISCCNLEQPNLTFVMDDNDDPELRTRIRFRGGIYLCRSQDEADAMKAIPNVYFENMSSGEAAPICPKSNCRFAFRNKDAMIRHVASHID